MPSAPAPDPFLRGVPAAALPNERAAAASVARSLRARGSANILGSVVARAAQMRHSFPGGDRGIPALRLKMPRKYSEEETADDYRRQVRVTQEIPEGRCVGHWRSRDSNTGLPSGLA